MAVSGKVRVSVRGEVEESDGGADIFHVVIP
jgi:hypothetical protein